jgi:hypothetical protein
MPLAVAGRGEALPAGGKPLPLTLPVGCRSPLCDGFRKTGTTIA